MRKQLIALCAVVICLTAALRADKFSIKGLGAPTGELGEALGFLASGDLAKADAKLQSVLQAHPGLALAELGRAQIALDTKRLADADRYVSSVLAKDPSSPPAHNMKGVVLLMQNKPDLARPEFQKAIQLAPTYVTPRIYLAALSRASQNFKQAALDYRALIDVAPRLAVGYLGLTEAQMLQNQRAEAFKTLEAWKAADAKTLLPFQVVASIYLAEGDAPKAVSELKSAVARKPNDPGILTTLGIAYAATGDDRSATAQYQAALAADPTAVDAVMGLGELELKAGRTDRALAQFRSALKIDPTSPMAGNDVAWLLAERGAPADLDEALKLARTVTANAPDYIDAQDTLGWVYYRRADYVNAITTLRKAKTLAPARLDIAAHLGLAYAKAGRKAEAAAELKRALAATGPIPNRAELERVLAEVSK